VIDVTMDLSEVDGQMAWARRQVLLVSVVLGDRHLHHRRPHPLLLHRAAGQGARSRHEADLGGDLDHFIDVTTNDEMGHLATSFNQMTLDLQSAGSKIQEGIRNLEHKVEERTRELRRPSRSSSIRRSSPPWGIGGDRWRTRSTTR